MSPKGVLWTVEHDRARLPDRLAADRAGVLERDGVALLRHDAAALDELVGEPQVSELARAPEQQILNDPSEPGEQDRCRRHALEQVVNRRDAAVGIAGRRRRSREARSSGRDRSESRCR